ncbi:MAG TPA: Rieske 2Fe-2S domain-containing protein [Ilumatobacteraceae bacterium]|nr:Rieske 2Fe-2S domain-containing protein [Ilumatobacteraceae bacterium]
MSSSVIIAIAVAAAVLLAAVVLLGAARKADVRGAGALSRETRKRDRDADIDLPPSGREVERAAAQSNAPATTAAPVAPAVWVAPDPEEIGVTRRQFLNRATVTLMGTSILTFAAASFVAFLWPTAAPIFGGKVNVGKKDDILASIRSNNGFFYSSSARSYLTVYPPEALPKAKGVKEYGPILSGLEEGIIASYQKCPHLGCRVPQCNSSQWFECPCHGSQYNRVGEKKGGPAPRGMDHFAVTVSGSGDVVIDTSIVVTGVAIGVNTTGQEAEGPHCITGGGGHG